jgi:YebC/PmpR family DNA-binding regulatory protein
MKKAKVYGKLGKLILQAAKAGGPDPVANARLRDALAVAKQANCPRDIIDRNIKKASDKAQADFAEVLYEAYGPGGTGLLISALTDSPNRAAGDVRTVFAKAKAAGAKLAESGSVSFSFQRVGIIMLEPAPGLDEDAVLTAAADAGAEDAAPAPGGRWRVTAAPSDFGVVRDALAAAGLAVAADASGLEYVPSNPVSLSDEDLEANEALIEKLLDLDDVDAVFCSGEGVMEEGDEEE